MAQRSSCTSLFRTRAVPGIATDHFVDQLVYAARAHGWQPDLISWAETAGRNQRRFLAGVLPAVVFFVVGSALTEQLELPEPLERISSARAMIDLYIAPAAPPLAGG